jgi:hypothetical protein
MRARRSVLLLIAGVVALVSLAAAPGALAAGGYSMTISTAATTTSSVQCNPTNCYPTADGANLNVGDLENDMNAASYNGFEVGDYGGNGDTGTITIENSITDGYGLTLQPDTGDVVIDDTTDSGDTATINVFGLTIYAPISGPATGSSSLKVTGGEAILYAGTIGTTLAGLDFADGAQLVWSNATLSANTIAITGNLYGDGSSSVTFNAPDGTTLNDAGWGSGAFSEMTFDGPATLDGSFPTIGNEETQTYEGAVSLSGDTTLGAHTTFDSTIDAGGSGGYGLTVNGSAVFDGLVGSVQELRSLSVSGATTINTGAVTTSGTQGYGAVTLDESPTLSGSTITFNSTVNGYYTLTVEDTVGTVFDGAVGGTTPLATLGIQPESGSTVELAANVTTAGDQHYDQAVTLGGAVTLSGGRMAVEAGLSGSNTLTVADGTLELDTSDDTLTGGDLLVDSSATVDFVSGALSTGTVTLDGGTLVWDSSNTSAPNAIDIHSGGTLDVGANDVTLTTGTGGTNGGALFKVGSGDLTLAAGSGASYGNLVEVSSGPLTVTGSIVTPVAVESGTTLVCDGGTLGGAVTNSGGTLYGGPSAPTAVTATDAAGVAGVAGVAFTPGASNCNPVSYTADQVGGAASKSGTSSPLNFSALTLGQAYSFTVTETNPLGSATSSASSPLFLPVAPSVSISAPAQNASYTQGQVVDAAYTCTEASGGPGIASCSGPVAGGAALDTSTVGIHTFAVTATSQDGETASQSYTYTVAAPPPVTTTTPDPSSTQSGSPTSGGSNASVSNTFSVKTLTGAASGAVKLGLSLPGAGSVKVTETIAGVGTVTASYSQSHGGSCKLATRLSKKLQALLRRKHVKHATVKIAFTPVGGSTRTVSKTVTL